jgi:hypothetical protein
MAHKVIGDKVVVDWTTGDPEGDRLTLLGAYRDLINEVKTIIDNEIEGNAGYLIDRLFQKWNINTGDQIDEVPRIWIKRPNAG